MVARIFGARKFFSQIANGERGIFRESNFVSNCVKASRKDEKAASLYRNFS